MTIETRFNLGDQVVISNPNDPESGRVFFVRKIETAAMYTPSPPVHTPISIWYVLATNDLPGRTIVRSEDALMPFSEAAGQ